MNIRQFLLPCLLLALLLALADCGLRINKNLMLVDDQGRELQIHGGCVVVKVPPYFPRLDKFDASFSFVERDYEIYKELGMNGVRLGAMYNCDNLGGKAWSPRRIGTTKPTSRRWSSS